MGDKVTLMGNYRLKCLECGTYIEDDLTLNCDDHNSLLRTEYDAPRLDTKDMGGVFKFYDWLPVLSTIPSDAAPIAFRNTDLSDELGLDDLWICFTGYYPERGGFVRSCSFKEMEALPTMARLRDKGGGTIVVASAGNTGRAFAQVSNDIRMGSLIIVPERSRSRIRISGDRGYAKLLTVKGDYTDAIRISERISSSKGFVPEGGARNVARRDGMGTTMLETAIMMKGIPHYYFQAIGSGTGAISAWEASMRLIADGRFGNVLPELHLSQNEPFIPMKKAWDERRRDIIEEDMGDAERDIAKVYADVLTNRSPPYSVNGGVFDAMTSCGGSIYGIINDEAEDAQKLWKEYEDVSIDPAAAVALASLLKALENDTIERKRSVMLNITGGGYDRVSKDIDMKVVRPYASVTANISGEELWGILNG